MGYFKGWWRGEFEVILKIRGEKQSVGSLLWAVLSSWGSRSLAWNSKDCRRKGGVSLLAAKAAFESGQSPIFPNSYAISQAWGENSIFPHPLLSHSLPKINVVKNEGSWAKPISKTNNQGSFSSAGQNQRQTSWRSFCLRLFIITIIPSLNIKQHDIYKKIKIKTRFNLYISYFNKYLKYNNRN